MTETHLGASRIAGPDVCRAILLIGELNPYGADPRYALYHEPERAAGHRLQRAIFSIGARQWYLPMWRVNLCVGHWDIDEARGRAAELIYGSVRDGVNGAIRDGTVDAVPWSVIVALGKNVMSAISRAVGPVMMPFDHYGTNAAERSIAGGAQIIALPHPSGRNAASWTAANITRARELMRRVAPAIPWGELG